jgi:tRNA U34 5-methylaminomethyl-2-thiouridine-forming methyltransferase MnmC
MQREIQLTADGSHTISIPEMNVLYHSKHGAIQESKHVFIEAGLCYLINQQNLRSIKIVEIGFGTGLNALLSWQMANKLKVPVEYTTIEPFPISREEANTINHGHLLSMEESFQQIHASPWGLDIILNDYFTLQKINSSLSDFNTPHLFNCIYFDAFDPLTQPELWTQAVFEKLFSFLQPGGTLLTYCSKSLIRQAMTAVGFTVQKIPGPYGKREMVRAIKS